LNVVVYFLTHKHVGLRILQPQNTAVRIHQCNRPMDATGSIGLGSWVIMDQQIWLGHMAQYPWPNNHD